MSNENVGNNLEQEPPMRSYAETLDEQAVFALKVAVRDMRGRIAGLEFLNEAAKRRHERELHRINQRHGQETIRNMAHHLMLNALRELNTDLTEMRTTPRLTVLNRIRDIINAETSGGYLLEAEHDYLRNVDYEQVDVNGGN